MTSYTRHPSYFDLAYMKIAGIEEHHQIESTCSIRIMFASNKQLSLGTCQASTPAVLVKTMYMCCSITETDQKGYATKQRQDSKRTVLFLADTCTSNRRFFEMRLFCIYIILQMSDIYLPLTVGATVYFAQPDALNVSLPPMHTSLPPCFFVHVHVQ